MWIRTHSWYWNSPPTTTHWCHCHFNFGLLFARSLSLSLALSSSSPPYRFRLFWFGVVCENLCAFLLCMAVVGAFGAFVLRIPVYSGIQCLLADFVAAKSKANSWRKREKKKIKRKSSLFAVNEERIYSIFFIRFTCAGCILFIIIIISGKKRW